MKIARTNYAPALRGGTAQAARALKDRLRWRAALLMAGCLGIGSLGFQMGQLAVYAHWVQSLQQQTMMMLLHAERLMDVQPVADDPAALNAPGDHEYDYGDAPSVLIKPLIEA